MQRIAARTVVYGAVVVLLALASQALAGVLRDHRQGEETPLDNGSLNVALADHGDDHDQVRTEEPAPAAPPARLRLQPVINEGAGQLPEGVRVVRNGYSVMVHFDVPLLRTRRPDKFERFVRATLPQLYGAAADSLLADLPEGMLTADGDLLSELPARGIHLPSTGAPVLSIFPQTRPGSEGPLVIAYLVQVAR
jgi:hypothetical protein